MDSRTKFINAINHKDSEIPVDYLAHPITDNNLKRYYDITTEKELLDILNCDFYYLSCRDISQNESLKSIYKGPELKSTVEKRICPFGIGWTRGAFQSKFAVDESTYHPLEQAQSEKDILSFKWPDLNWFDFEGFLKEIEDNQNRVIIGGFWSGILGDSYRMHGFENFLYNILSKPAMIKTLINKMTDFYLELNNKLFEQIGDKIDVWFFGNDLGSQNSLLFSPQMLSDLFMENFKKLCDLSHDYNIKVMMHSCGSIAKIIPMLIEAGVDILDPIQVSADNMQIENLKKDFGNRLTFHGGIDTQHILPNGKPNDIKEHCTKTAKILGQNGGYFFAPSQILSPDIPVENIDMMYKTINQINAIKQVNNSK